MWNNISLLEIILGSTLYITFAFLIGFKQYNLSKDLKYPDEVEYPGALGAFLGLVWPITLLVYAVRKTLIEPWT